MKGKQLGSPAVRHASSPPAPARLHLSPAGKAILGIGIGHGAADQWDGPCLAMGLEGRPCSLGSALMDFG